MDPAGPRTLEQLYAAACASIDRFEPLDAYRATGRGALIVDIRSDTSRARDGVVPGACHIPRTVLEWRAAPDSPWRNPHLGGPEQQLILLCDHGYSSALAAATLRGLGLLSTGDVIDGFVGWRTAGLPVAPAPAPFDGVPGTAPPDPG
jgi:rhodanese-related sulfurtransferase